MVMLCTLRVLFAVQNDNTLVGVFSGHSTMTKTMQETDHQMRYSNVTSMPYVIVASLLIAHMLQL